jgi:hypothetical protein
VQGVQTTQFFHLAFHNTVANHSSSGRQLVSLNIDVLTELSAINSDETIGQSDLKIIVLYYFISIGATACTGENKILQK